MHSPRIDETLHCVCDPEVFQGKGNVYETYSGLPVAGITVAASKYTECNTFKF